MQIQKGSIVKATAGRDNERFFLVIGLEKERAHLVDGKTRKIKKPKVKNLKHIAATSNRVDCGEYKTDKAIRALMHKFNYPQENINSKGDKDG